MSTPDSFGSPDGRTYSTPETAGQAAGLGAALCGEPPAAFMRWNRIGLGRGYVSDEMLAHAWRMLIPEAHEFWAEVEAAIAAAAPAADELAMLRADLADYEKLRARWPKCPAGCNCRIGLPDDADANECGCDGPCNGGAAPAPAASASHPICHTPAVVRPELGSVIVLALQNETPEASAQELASTLAALNQGIAVVTVRGVDALRTWEPQPQAAPRPALPVELDRLIRNWRDAASEAEDAPSGDHASRAEAETLREVIRQVQATGLTASAPQAAPELAAAALETELRDIITEAARCRSSKQPCPFCERLIARAMKAAGAGQPGTES